MEKQTHSQKPQSALAAGHRLQTESDMCQSHLDRPLETDGQCCIEDYR